MNLNSNTCVTPSCGVNIYEKEILHTFLHSESCSALVALRNSCGSKSRRATRAVQQQVQYFNAIFDGCMVFQIMNLIKNLTNISDNLNSDRFSR